LHSPRVLDFSDKNEIYKNYGHNEVNFSCSACKNDWRATTRRFNSGQKMKHSLLLRKQVSYDDIIIS
jgi:hypothetical protein